MNLCKSVSLLVMISFLQGLTLPVLAQETICGSDQPRHCATPLKAGEVAPYDGQLLSPELALDLGLKADFCDRRMGLELDFIKKDLGLELNLAQKLRVLDKQAWAGERTLLLTRLEEAHIRPWFEHPVFVAGVTVILTFLVVLGARQTLNALD